MEHLNPASRIGPEAQIGHQEANMRKFLFAAAIAAIAIPASAYAQDEHHNADRQDQTSLYGQNAQSEHRGDRNTQAPAAQDNHRNAGREDLRNGRDEHRGNAGEDRHFSYRGHEFAAVRSQEFRYPRGWQYRAWSAGQTLPNLFLGQPYNFDYQTIGLPPPPRGERWVRFGPDALLVNIRSRRIVDVIHNVFYT